MGFYPTREAVQKLLGFETATRQPSQMQHYLVTIGLFLVITVLGISVRSLGKVYALIGGFAATFLAYILPAFACLVTRRYPAVTDDVKQPLLADDENDQRQTPSSLALQGEDTSIPPFGLLDWSALFLMIWGTIVMVFATSGAFK